MGSIGRYIFRTAFAAFLLVLLSLTAVVWLAQALRDVDLMTSQGQTVLVFVGITSLIIPLLVMVIAPIALMIAVCHLLHKLSADSEIVVMNGAGMKPWALFKPFAMVALVVTVMIAVISAYLAPKSLRMLRDRIVQVRADLVTNVVQPGRFTPLERGLAFHIRERRPNGLLVGILMDDRRDEKERVTIVAEQGEITKNENGSFLILENGTIQRQTAGQRDPTFVRFERYAFDLTRFGSSPMVVTYSVRERYLWQLINPDPNDPQYKEQPGQFWAELNDRIVGLLYPITFVVIAYAFLGVPRTTRQSAMWSIVAVITNVSALRLLGFAGTIFTIKYPAAAALQYLAIAAALFFGLRSISRGNILEPPPGLVSAVESMGQWMARRQGAVARPAT